MAEKSNLGQASYDKTRGKSGEQKVRNAFIKERSELGGLL